LHVLARLVAEPFLYALGLLAAATGIAAGIKAPHYAFPLIGCAAGAFCAVWGGGQAGGAEPRAGSSPPPIFHLQ
jgi:hypothetical protein